MKRAERLASRTERGHRHPGRRAWAPLKHKPEALLRRLELAVTRAVGPGLR